MDLDKLAAAKLWLISPPPDHGPGGSTEPPRDLPYLAHALYALVPVACADVPTISADEHWRAYINPDWLTAAAVPEAAAELAHLVWHLLADHTDRARDQHVDATTVEQWTQAADATLAHTLAADRLGPTRLRPARDFGLPPGRSAEEYYARLARMQVAPPDGGADGSLLPAIGCGSACDGLRREHELPPDAEAGAVTPEDAAQIRRSVAIEYREHATRRGDKPGDAWRWAEQILEPRVAWEPLLAGAVRRAVGWTNGRVEYTHTRPSRRQSAVPRVVLPGMRRPTPNVAFVVDTSGSVDDALLGRALGEVDGALRALGVGDSAVTVYACDAAVHAVAKVRRARDAALAGGGGTDLRVGVSAAAEQRPRADLIVVFTDGFTPWPAAPPAGIAMIAAILGRDGRQMPPTPDWATRVECLLE
jgi:predicted metal-dependent peptidase